jgi:uncharacterized protein (TIGR03437 family)
MRWGFALILIGLGVPGVGSVFGQTISFLRQFTTPAMDRADAVAADATGIYVIGNRPELTGHPDRAAVRKYDTSGNELWTREFSAAGRGIRFLKAASATSGIYLADNDEAGRLYIRHYSPDGEEVFVRQLEFSGLGALAANATGVYIAGRDFPDAAYLGKYDSNGVQLWTSRWGDRSNLEFEFPHHMAVDATGVYVLGTASAGGALVALVRKWDLRGSELWNRELGLAGPVFGVAAAAPSGFYTVIGDAGNYSLRKYDAAGNSVWARQVATPVVLYAGPVYAGAIAADATGVYLVGGTSLAGLSLPGQCMHSPGGDIFVRKYDPDGTEVWTRQFGTADAVGVSAVALDASGVYVVGQEGTAQVRDDLEHVDAFEPANSSRGAFVVKFEKAAAAAAGSGPRIFPGCVVNAGSYVGGGVSPGEIVTVFGAAMGPPERVPPTVTADRRLATTLAGTRILFNGVAAPLMYVSDKQSSAIVPASVAGRTSVDVQVEYNGVRSEAERVPVLASRPGVFSPDGSGRGQGAILNEDGSPNSASNPARRGSIVTIFATGGGEAAPGIEDGQVLSDVLPELNLPVSVIFDLRNNEFQVSAKPGEVQYAGGVSGSVAGLLQVKVRVPADAVATGNQVPFLLIIGSHWTVHQVTIALR